jgi:hypothetical protein
MNVREILKLLDVLHELEVNHVERFVDLSLDDDPCLLSLAEAYQRKRITRHTYCSGVRDRINDYFRKQVKDLCTDEYLVSIRAPRRQH